MIEWHKKLSRKTSFWYRFSIMIVCSLVVTIGTLYILRYLLNLGNWGDYLAGAIAGGLWGYVWKMYLEESPGKKWYTLTPLRYIGILVGMSVGFIVMILIMLLHLIKFIS